MHTGNEAPRQRVSKGKGRSERYEERYAKQGSGDEKKPAKQSEYDAILAWFASGNLVTLTDTMGLDAYEAELLRVPHLREVTERHMRLEGADRGELASAMEFVLDGLHQHSKLAKEESFGSPEVTYKDMIGSIFSPRPNSAVSDQEDEDYS